MSRCFPYPPPSYDLCRGRRGEALIESIEIQRERVPESGKRNEKRERKEKRRQHKKNKDKSTDGFAWNAKKLEDELPFQTENESEKSAVTEEHGQPVLLDSLSDGSDSSSKRKRANAAPSNAFERNGKKLRISFTLKKQPVLDLSIDEQQVCSTSGREVVQEPTPTNASNQTPEDINKHGFSAREEIPETLFSENKKPKSVASQYELLFEHWVPPSLSQIPDGGESDLDWLLPRKSQSCKRKAINAQDGVSFSGGTNIFPRACYLAEADVFALPFVTPF